MGRAHKTGFQNRALKVAPDGMSCHCFTRISFGMGVIDKKSLDRCFRASNRTGPFCFYVMSQIIMDYARYDNCARLQAFGFIQRQCDVAVATIFLEILVLRQSEVGAFVKSHSCGDSKAGNEPVSAWTTISFVSGDRTKFGEHSLKSFGRKCLSRFTVIGSRKQFTRFDRIVAGLDMRHPGNCIISGFDTFFVKLFRIKFNQALPGRPFIEVNDGAEPAAYCCNSISFTGFR